MASGRDLIATDGLAHICAAKMMKRRGHKPFLILPQTQDSGECYPWLYSWLLSFLPERCMMQIGMLTGAICDTLLFGLVLWAIASFGVTISQSHVLLLAVLYAFTPHLTRMKIGKLVPRPRPLSMLLGNTLLVMLLLSHSLGNNMIMYLAAIMLFSCMISLSRFGVQAILLYSIVLGLYLGNMMILWFPVVGFLASIILTKGSSVRLTVGHLRFMKLYWSTFYYLVKDYNAIHMPRGIDKCELRRFLESLSNNAYVLFLLGLPFAFPICARVANGLGWGTAYDARIDAWLLAALVSMLLTSVGRMKVLGQAERYLDYAMVPYFICVVIISLSMSSWIIGALILYGVVSCVLHAALHFRFYGINKAYLGELEAGYRWLNRYSSRMTVISIPYVFSRIGVLETKHEFPFTQGWSYRDKEHLDEIYSVYPYPPRDIVRVINRCGVDLIVAVKGKCKDISIGNNAQMVYANEAVEIFDVRNVEHGAVSPSLQVNAV